MSNWKEEWQTYSEEETYGHPSWFFEELGWEQVQDEIVGTWRWGNLCEDVWKGPDGELLMVSYMDASGDSDIDLDGMNVEIHPVEAREVTTVKYVKL